MYENNPNHEHNLELISVHYAKAGGTSLWAELKRHYGDALFSDNNHDPCNSNQKNNPPFLLSPETKAVMGHIRPDLYIASKSTKIITFLRDPVDKLLSAYFYWLNLPLGGSPEHEAFVTNRPSIFEYAEEGAGVSIEAYFGGFDMDRFDFIGFHDQRAEHLACLSNLLGFEISSEVKLNVTPFSSERAAIQSDDRSMSRLRELLKVEVEFYNDLRSKWLPKLKQLEALPGHMREAYSVAATDGGGGPVLPAIGEQEQLVQRLYRSLDDMTHRNEELLTQKDMLSLALDEREARYGSIAGDLQKATEELTASQASLAAIQSELVDTRRRLDERLEELESTNSLLKERQEKLEAATQSLEERNVQLFRAEEEIATLRVSVTSLEAQLKKAAAGSAAMQREIALLEARQVEIDGQRSRAQQEIQLLESRLRQRDEEISQTSQELKSTRMELEEASNKVEDLTAANATLGSERDSQAEEIEALEALVRSLENDKAAIEAKFGESEQWVFELAGTRANYEKEIAKLSRRLAAEEKLRKNEDAKHSRDLLELKRLRTRLGEVEQEMRSELAAAAIERDDELAKLTRLLCEKEDELESQKRKHSAEAADASKRHVAELAERFDEIATITLLLREKEDELETQNRKHSVEAADASKRHAAELAERFDEIATITRILREAQRKQSSVLGSLEAAKKIASVLQGLPWWWSLLPKSLRDKQKFAHLRRLGLFDGERYLQIYPDVAAEQMDPLEHYLSHGMAEGRTSAID